MDLIFIDLYGYWFFLSSLDPAYRSSNSQAVKPPPYFQVSNTVAADCPLCQLPLGTAECFDAHTERQHWVEVSDLWMQEMGKGSDEETRQISRGGEAFLLSSLLPPD